LLPQVDIDWGKYGKYTMAVGADARSMDGSAVGAPENWRKAQMKREHTAAEKCITGHEVRPAHLSQ
jgi:hypothetical protein